MFKNLFSRKKNEEKLSSKEFDNLLQRYKKEFFESYMVSDENWIKVFSMILPTYGVDPGLFNPVNMVLADYTRLRIGAYTENCVFLTSLEKDPALRGKKLLESIRKTKEEIIELRRDIQWDVRIEETPRISTLISFMSFKDKTFKKNNGIWIVDKVFDLVFGEERVEPNDLIQSKEESEFILDYLLPDQYCFRVIQKIYCDFSNYGHILLGTLRSGGKVMRKRSLGKKMAIGGAILGTAYGVGNDLRRQRKKAEDAIGDHVADSLRRIVMINKPHYNKNKEEELSFSSSSFLHSIITITIY